MEIVWDDRGTRAAEWTAFKITVLTEMKSTHKTSFNYLVATSVLANGMDS